MSYAPGVADDRSFDADDLVGPEHGGGHAERLNIRELGEMLRERRGGLSIRAAAKDAGVSFSTFSRVESGSHPDLATFSRLCGWRGVSPTRFFASVPQRELSPLDEAISHLRTDPRLSAEASKAISSMMRDMYGALASQVAPPSAVACHLRAEQVLRPGVPERLSSILSDMNAELQRRYETGELKL